MPEGGLEVHQRLRSGMPDPARKRARQAGWDESRYQQDTGRPASTLRILPGNWSISRQPAVRLTIPA